MKVTDGYNGLYGAPPDKASEDVQTPFDNMAWQMFVTLNWAANAVNQLSATGLTKPGLRVWHDQDGAVIGAGHGRREISLPRSASFTITCRA